MLNSHHKLCARAAAAEPPFAFWHTTPTAAHKITTDPSDDYLKNKSVYRLIRAINLQFLDKIDF